MQPIKVVVLGASGKVGREVIRALCTAPDMQPVGAVELEAATDSLALPDGGSIPFSSDLSSILDKCQPDVIIDFTNAKAAMAAVRIAAAKGVHIVSGSTGLSPEELEEVDRLTKENGIGVVIAPNFALGAVLMMHLAQLAARYFDYAEIIELHHEKKLDAPSGTSLKTARMMAEARGRPFCQPADKAESRGQQVEGISIHSVRLPGILACQEVILGCAGQTLAIRHDTTSRECYMPGVMLAAREVAKHKGLIHGLDSLLEL